MQAEKLTAGQIDKLYAFTRQHYVAHYDVQTELVDHLANGIEAAWEENPQLKFDERLHKEFKKFGVFGFMDVVEKRQAALSKKYRKLVWQYVKNYLKFPKIAATVLFALLYFITLNTIGFKHAFAVVSSLLLFFVSTGFTIKLQVKNKKTNKQTGKSWLFRDIIFNAGIISFIIFPQICHSIYLYSDEAFAEIYFQIIFSVVFTLASLAEYIVLFIIPSKAEEHLRNTYPEYALEVSK